MQPFGFLKRIIFLTIIFGLGFTVGFKLLSSTGLDSLVPAVRQPPASSGFSTIRSNAAPDPAKIPDGSTPQRVMSIDVRDVAPSTFFGILADTTGKEFRICDALAGHITYQKRDVPWQIIFDEVATANGWETRHTANFVEVCTANR